MGIQVNPTSEKFSFIGIYLEIFKLIGVFILEIVE